MELFREMIATRAFLLLSYVIADKAIYKQVSETSRLLLLKATEEDLREFVKYLQSMSGLSLDIEEQVEHMKTKQEAARDKEAWHEKAEKDRLFLLTGK